jgi:hypothetical protein
MGSAHGSLDDLSANIDRMMQVSESSVTLTCGQTALSSSSLVADPVGVLDDYEMDRSSKPTFYQSSTPTALGETPNRRWSRCNISEAVFGRGKCEPPQRRARREVERLQCEDQRKVRNVSSRRRTGTAEEQRPNAEVAARSITCGVAHTAVANVARSVT